MLGPADVLVFMLYMICTLGVVHACVGIVRTAYARWDASSMDPEAASATKMIWFDYGPPYGLTGARSRNFTRRIARFALIALTFASFRGIFRGFAAHMENPLMLWGLLDDKLVVFIHDGGAYLLMGVCAMYLAIYRHPWVRSTSDRDGTD